MAASSLGGCSICVLALLGLVACVRPAHAANNCPWMNETTASSLIGGDAVGAYTAATEANPAACTFAQVTSEGKRTLEITVQSVPAPQARLVQAEQSCGSDPAPLHAIGNEAIFCTGEDRPSLRSERAVGRVRDQIFTITFTTSIPNDPTFTRKTMKARIYTAAEQVAGNLF